MAIPSSASVSATVLLLVTDKLSLVPINFRDPSQYAEFKRQRVLCGWDHLDEDIEQFIEMQDKNLKSLFWIMIKPKPQVNSKDENSDNNSHNEVQVAELFTTRAGHISLNAYAEPPDPELALGDKTILTVQTFYILSEYRMGGLGGAAMKLMEVLAKQEPYGGPQCHTLTLTTTNKKYITKDGYEWKDTWKRFGWEIPPFSNQDWYQRLGYVYWKEEPRYHLQNLAGEYETLIVSFMRKRLR